MLRQHPERRSNPQVLHEASQMCCCSCKKVTRPLETCQNGFWLDAQVTLCIANIINWYFLTFSFVYSNELPERLPLPPTPLTTHYQFSPLHISIFKMFAQQSFHPRALRDKLSCWASSLNGGPITNQLHYGKCISSSRSSSEVSVLHYSNEHL